VPEELFAPAADPGAVARLAALDPASSGGLADALARGVLAGYRDLDALRPALRIFRSARRSQPRGSSS
jgi:hypothetical protein